MSHGNGLLAASKPLRDDVLAVLPQLSSIADTESMFEDISYFLERQARYFRIEEVDEDPAEATDGSVETKRAGWGHALHHGEEGRRDDDVGAPAGTVTHVKCKCLEELGRLRLLTKSGTLFPLHALP